MVSPYNPRMRLSPVVKRIALCIALLLAAWLLWVGVSILLLPSVKPLRDPRISFAITVKDWSRKDRPFVVGPKNRNWTPYGSIPSAMRKAVVVAEDGRFYEHDGVDFDALKEAMKTNIDKGKYAVGGSTITQQLAKNLYLSREKTLTRKVKEFVLARRIDDALTKNRILELYLNVVELGPMVYGVGHGARYYFGKSASELSTRECAFLAAMLPGPRVYNPYRKPQKVMKRSDRILKRMFQARMISEGEFQSAVAETPNLAGIERKVESTLASSPPPAEVPSVTTTADQLPAVPSE